MVAESALIRHQVLILNRGCKRAPNLRVTDRLTAGSLGISGNSNGAEHGGWERRVAGVLAGSWYRFVAHYRAEAVPSESWQVD